MTAGRAATGMGVPAAGPSRERRSGQTTATDSDSVGNPSVVASIFPGSRMCSGGHRRARQRRHRRLGPGAVCRPNVAFENHSGWPFAAMAGPTMPAHPPRARWCIAAAVVELDGGCVNRYSGHYEACHAGTAAAAPPSPLSFIAGLLNAGSTSHGFGPTSVSRGSRYHRFVIFGEL